MTDSLFGLIYVASLVACGAFVWLGFKGIRGDYTNTYYFSGLIPGVAGFAVFPIINTIVALSLALYLASKERPAP
jgi:TRAP-type C4-dicarboxylate transport system permease small subunit